MPGMDSIQIDNELSSVIDLTAMILVSLKNDPTPPSSPIQSSSSSPSSSSSSPRPVTPSSSSSQAAGRSTSTPCLPLKTELCDCMLCTRTAPIILSKCHTWAWIMRVVFYSLRDRYPEKKFFSLKNDVYEYMMNHWNILGLDRKPSANWHKQIQDMLSHSRNIFESGMTHFKQNGFWRLKDLEDPWTARPDTPRPPSTTPPQTPVPSSPRKRGWKNTQSDEEQEREEEVQATLKKLCTPPTSPRLSLTASQELSSIPSSPEPSTPIHLKASEELEKEVAILREQLNHMTESIAQLSTESLATPDFQTPSSSSPSSGTSSPTPNHPNQQQFAVFSHNRAWEESYSKIGSVQA